MSSHHKWQLVNVLPVLLQTSRKFNTNIATPTQSDVQVTVSNGELVAHKILVGTTSEITLFDVGKLLGESFFLCCFSFLTERTKERSEVGMHLTGNVVESSLNQITLTGSIGGSNGSRRLYIR